MALLDDVRLFVRYTTNAFDGELQGFIDAAAAEMARVKIDTTNIATDPLLKQAVKLYAKANTGAKDADRYEAAFYKLCDSLALSGEYLVAGGDVDA